jgi:hypothetical protein
LEVSPFSQYIIPNYSPKRKLKELLLSNELSKKDKGNIPVPDAGSSDISSNMEHRTVDV